MDPIHPIVPVTPHILPILPTPMVGHVDRDAQRDQAEGRRSRDRRRRDGGAESGATDREALPELPPPDVNMDDDGRGHVDLTA
jgi:hypothetical protein